MIELQSAVGGRLHCLSRYSLMKAPQALGDAWSRKKTHGHWSEESDISITFQQLLCGIAKVVL